jgi:hypothetical protein
MKYDIQKVTLDVNVRENRSLAILPGCIPGATPFHHTILKGSTLTLEAGECHHILTMIAGDAAFATDGNEYVFHERVVFVPDPKKPAEMTALTDVHVLEVRWAKRPGEDDALAAEYHTQFPLIQVYRNSKQYRDRNKSDKTISRSCIDQRRIPRFALGSVETYGFDAVKSHDHPMLDQYFFSFPENDMDVLIDFEAVPMKGCELLYIPLGSMHGVDVPPGKHCHYMWLDFYPDNDEALKRLDWSHVPTGRQASFNAKTGERA